MNHTTRDASEPRPGHRALSLRAPVLQVVTALLGTALLAVAVVTTVVAGRTAALDDLDHALDAEASSDASVLTEYFERAQSLNLLLANDSAFRQFAPNALTGSGPTLTTASAEAGAAMAYLERLYPGRISEACLIDSSGTEIARVVRGQVAPAEELSTEEAKAPFFLPTLQMAEGEVHQAAPYLSPDTGQWVISNSTPMVAVPGEAPWGLVHFEVALDSFRPTGTPDGMSASLLDVRSGRILLEDGVELEDEALGRPASASLRALAAATTTSAAATIDGERVRVVRVATGPGNVNEWAVVVSAPVDVVSSSRSVGPAPVAMGLAAVLLLAFAGLNLRASHRRLRHASLYDELTGLPNRRLLNERLDQALLLGRRRRGTCAVLLVDLDRFKEVNDTLGHHHGDQLLRAAADRLRGVVRDSDTVARLGGDEFGILLPDVADAPAALVLAQRCLEALHETFTVDGIDLDIEASIGVAIGPTHGSDSNDLVRAADVAMYEAKSQSHGAVLYEAELDVHTPHRLALLGDLRRALQNDELVLHYQPKVGVSTDDVSGVEALVRWHHPTRGMVPPDAFVPVAEGTGLIMPLTLRTLELAIGQARVWKDLGHPVQVAVNLSPRCLLEIEFPTLVRRMLEQHELPARLLRLELTESTIMADPARALAVLSELKALGIALSIDDFGTGYSSMSYLKRLPVDELKIDRSFVMEMLAHQDDAVLVRSSIDLGHNLGMSVVAEGVEDEETLSALSALGCDVVQGYHLSRPMAPEALTEWFRERRALPDRLDAGAALSGSASDARQP